MKPEFSPLGAQAQRPGESALGVRIRGRTRRTGVGLVVIGLHLIGGLAWWAVGRSVQTVRLAAEAPRVTVSLQVMAEPANATVKPNGDPRPARSAPPTWRPSNPIAPDGPVTLVPLPASGRTPSPAESLPPSPPLNLTLPRQALAPPNFADKSVFQGRLPATVEQQIAAAVGESGPWTEERIDINHIRMRRGNTCIHLERSATAQRFPFDESSSRTPWRASTSRCQ